MRLSLKSKEMRFQHQDGQWGSDPTRQAITAKQSPTRAAEVARPFSPAPMGCARTAEGFLLPHNPVSLAITVLKVLWMLECINRSTLFPKGNPFVIFVGVYSWLEVN